MPWCLAHWKAFRLPSRPNSTTLTRIFIITPPTSSFQDDCEFSELLWLTCFRLIRDDCRRTISYSLGDNAPFFLIKNVIKNWSVILVWDACNHSYSIVITSQGRGGGVRVCKWIWVGECLPYFNASFPNLSFPSPSQHCWTLIECIRFSLQHYYERHASAGATLQCPPCFPFVLVVRR